MADLRTNFVGIKSPNPFWLASAPPTDKEYNVVRAFKAGWGGVVWKTLGEDPPVVTGTDWVDSVQLVGEEAAAPAPHFEIPLLVEQQTSDIQVPLAGQAGLLMLLRAGTLKPASAAELDAWMRRYVAAGEDAPELMDRRLRALPVYTIQGEMQFPADLNDDHAIERFAEEVRSAAGVDPGGRVRNALRAAERLGCVVLPLSEELGHGAQDALQRLLGWNPPTG